LLQEKRYKCKYETEVKSLDTQEDKQLNKHNTTGPSAARPRPELLQVAEAVAREKNIDREESIVAMESAIQRAAKAKYGIEHDIRATIDRDTGEIVISRVVTVVDDVENPMCEISLEDARLKEPDAEVGFEFTEILPPLAFGRSAAQGSRQVIIQKIREAERVRQFDEFLERKGEIVNGTVKHVDRNQIIVDIGSTEGVIHSDNNIPRQVFNVGERVKALLVDIRPESHGPMLILSRTHNDFITKLFEQDVTEIYDGLIKVMAIARDPGSRAKMAVYSPDNRVDPVGSCVGVRGSRVQSIISEIQGEKIDIVLWSSDPATYVMNALSLQDIKRVVIDEDEDTIDVVVADEFLSQAIGRRGQNVRLASQLTGWKIMVVAESEDTSRRAIERASRIKTLIDSLGIDEMLAQLLVSEGFISVDDIAQADVSDFTSIEGFQEDSARDLCQKAIAFVEEQEKKFFDKCEELDIRDDLLTLPNLDIGMFNKLVDSGIRTRDDVADLSTDELLDILGEEALPRSKADAVILDARKEWFDEENEQ
jgi:N utilization substance protein A